MICAFFSKDFADSFLRAVQKGKPFAPPPDPVTGQRAWTANNMLSLAGLLFAVASRKEPREFRDTDIKVAEQIVRPEDRDRLLELHCTELHAALDFLSSMAAALWSGQYPASWESSMSGWIDEEEPQFPPDLHLFIGDEFRRSC